MAELGGRFEEVLRSASSPEQLRARLIDRARIIAATEGVERSELIGQDTIHLVLQEQRHAGFSFRPDYRVRYWADGDAVAWEPVQPSNLLNRGRVVVRADGAGSLAQWSQQVSFEIAIPRMVIPMIRPVIDTILAPSLRRLATQLVEGG